MANGHERDTVRSKAALTTNPAQRGLIKGEAAYERRARITQVSQEDNYTITYTSGSMKEKEQEHQTGAGWVLYWKGWKGGVGAKEWEDLLRFTIPRCWRC